MVKVIYNDKLEYKVIIWVFFVISLWKKKEALKYGGGIHWYLFIFYLFTAEQLRVMLGDPMGYHYSYCLVIL